jgi:hypothetical protein
MEAGSPGAQAVERLLGRNIFPRNHPHGSPQRFGTSPRPFESKGEGSTDEDAQVFALKAQRALRKALSVIRDDTTPGFPYSAERSTVTGVYEDPCLWARVVENLVVLIALSRWCVEIPGFADALLQSSVKYPLALAKWGLLDPLQTFPKDEPHPRRKKFRRIIAVCPFPLQIFERIFWHDYKETVKDCFTESEISHSRPPCKIGIGFSGDAHEKIRKDLKELEVSPDGSARIPVVSDVKSYDSTMSLDMNIATASIKSRLNRDSVLETAMGYVWAIVISTMPWAVPSDRTCDATLGYVKLVPGQFPSGSYATSIAAGISRPLVSEYVHLLAGLTPPRTLVVSQGDDCVESVRQSSAEGDLARMAEGYAKAGFTLREQNLGWPVIFCSHVHHRDRAGTRLVSWPKSVAKLFAQKLNFQAMDDVLRELTDESGNLLPVGHEVKRLTYLRAIEEVDGYFADLEDDS